VIISFAWTTPALLAGAKTVTRRDWKKQHAMQFAKGLLVDAYDKSPRQHVRKVATIRIKRDPHLETTAYLPIEEFAAEGFAWLAANGGSAEHARINEIWAEWRDSPRQLYVVEFELVDRVA